jgi:hypothetical protein
MRIYTASTYIESLAITTEPAVGTGTYGSSCGRLILAAAAAPTSARQALRQIFMVKIISAAIRGMFELKTNVVDVLAKHPARFPGFLAIFGLWLRQNEFEQQRNGILGCPRY